MCLPSPSARLGLLGLLVWTNQGYTEEVFSTADYETLVMREGVCSFSASTDDAEVTTHFCGLIY